MAAHIPVSFSLYSSSAIMGAVLRRPVFRRLEAALYLFLIYMLLASGITYGVWEYGIWQSEDAIWANPGFAQRLSAYAEAGRDWSVITKWFTLVEPFDNVTNQAKTIGVWDEVIRIADIARPGAGTAMNLLDMSIGSLLGIRDQVSSLARLDGSAGTVEQYIYKPTRASQQSLHDSFVDNMENINIFLYTLNGASPVIESLDQSFNIITGGLFEVQENGNQLVRPIARQLNGIFVPVQSNTNDFTDSFIKFRSALDADLATMHTIVRNTQRAQRVESIVAPWILRPLIGWVSEHLVSVALAILVGLLLRRRMDSFP